MKPAVNVKTPTISSIALHKNFIRLFADMMGYGLIIGVNAS